MNTLQNIWLTKQIEDLGFFGQFLNDLGATPANGGDISILIPSDVISELMEYKLINPKPSINLAFENIPELSDYREKDKSYYRAQGISQNKLQHLGFSNLNGKYFLMTTSGAKIWDIKRNPTKHLCIVRVDESDDGFSVFSFSDEFKPVPTTEFINHLVGHSINIDQGFDTSAVVHVHAQALIDLSRTSKTLSQDEFNRVLYSQRPELVVNIPDLIGLVPFELPGSESLVLKSNSVLRHHRCIMWQAHGIVVREITLERCVDLIHYAESAAESAIRYLQNPDLYSDFIRENIGEFVNEFSLNAKAMEIAS